MALNSGQAMPVLTKPKIGEENKLAIALQSNLIRVAVLDDIRESLRLVMVKIGLRAQNWPNDLEKLVLFEHIRENFGGNTVEEIKLAFEMAMAGKLDLPIEDVKCYENFSCAYFSLIMTSYQRWSSQAYRQIEKPVNVETKIFSQEELDNSAREDAERQYQMFLRGYALKGLEINKCILEHDGLLKEGESVIQFFNRKSDNGSTNIYTRV